MVALEQSILKNTKKMLNVGEGVDVFDLDIITHINTVFSTLTQLGVGPTEGYMIEDAEATWAEFLGTEPIAVRLNSVKTLVYAHVRLLFDPPTTPYFMAALERQIEELQFRLSVEADTTWVDPRLPIVLPEDLL